MNKAAEDRTADAAKPHILFVDDDYLTRRLYASILSASGFEVIHAKDGAEGREMARRFRPDLILLDMLMPVMSGVEAANRLKSEKKTADIPIVLFTNADLTVEAQRWMNDIGVEAYIPKAVGNDVFVARIKAVLESRAGGPARSRDN